MGYLTVDTPEHKIDMMLGVAMSKGIEPCDITFVDDKMDIVYKAIDAGIDGKHLSDIAALYEYELRSKLLDASKILKECSDDDYDSIMDML